MKRAIQFGLGMALAFGIGCGAGAGASALVVPPANAQGGYMRWDAYCFTSTDSNEVVQKARSLGSEGWEMVSGNMHRGVTHLERYMACFKRPMGPAPPAAPARW